MVPRLSSTATTTTTTSDDNFDRNHDHRHVHHTSMKNNCCRRRPSFWRVVLVAMMILSAINLVGVNNKATATNDSSSDVVDLLSIENNNNNNNNNRSPASSPPPLPILVLGMPKTGTSTIFQFLRRSGYISSHFMCRPRVRCGICIKAAIQQNKPPLKTCGNYEVWAQMDVDDRQSCFFPQITHLETLHNEAPHATFILNTRNLTNWAKSVQNWAPPLKEVLSERLASESCSPFGPKSSNASDLMEWHEQHLKRVREFAKQHPSHALIEVDIENPNTGNIMADFFHTNSSFWVIANKSKNKKKKSPQQQVVNATATKKDSSNDVSLSTNNASSRSRGNSENVTRRDTKNGTWPLGP